MIDPPYGVNYRRRPHRVPPPPQPSKLPAREATLAKAIEKAQAGGWVPEYTITYDKHLGWTATLKAEPKQPKNGLAANVTTMLSENDIIFDHDFAKALWGSSRLQVCAECGCPRGTIRDFDNSKVCDEYGTAASFVDGQYIWRLHLQGMVVADDPIIYLGENL
jgi:hypothetical protein